MRGMEAIEALARYFRVNVGDGEDRIEVLVDEMLPVTCFCRGDWLYFMGTISEVQPSDLEKIKRMLQWTLVRITEKSDPLAYNPQEKTLYLFRKKLLSQIFNDNIFREAESFVENLTFWREAFLYTGIASSGLMYVSRF